MDLVGICEYEEIYMWNVINGKCFSIYVICGEEGFGIILVNGGVVY